MTRRKVHIQGKVWEYFIGHGTVKIWSPDGKTFLAGFDKITGLSWNVIERGQWKRTSDGEVRPGQVASFIALHLVSGRE